MDEDEKRPASFNEVWLLCLHQLARETGSETLSAFLQAGKERAVATFKDSELMKATEEIAALKLQLSQAQGLKAVKPDADREASV